MKKETEWAKRLTYTRKREGGVSIKDIITHITLPLSVSLSGDSLSPSLCRITISLKCQQESKRNELKRERGEWTKRYNTKKERGVNAEDTQLLTPISLSPLISSPNPYLSSLHLSHSLRGQLSHCSRLLSPFTVT